MRRAVAACVALSCVVGLHTVRILFGFWQSNIHSPSLLLCWWPLPSRSIGGRVQFDWLFFPLTLTALLVLESGLLLAPLLVVLWWIQRARA